MTYFTTSWDDGNVLDLKIAKLLQEYDLKGTFYIPLRYAKRTLKDNHIKNLSKNFEIGSHGTSHLILTRLNEGEMRKELVLSKSILEEITGKSVNSYAYPFGKFNWKVIRIVRKVGYKYARTAKEFSTDVGNPLASGITIRATNNFSKILHPQILHLLVKSKFQWNELAKTIFMNCNSNSVFHLAGHSWDLENENFENQLVDFFEFVKKFDCKPITNLKSKGQWRR